MMGLVTPVVSQAARDDCLGIEVTTRCNGQCLHCFAHAGISQHASLPLGVVKNIIAEGYRAGYRQLHITGGEPLLWKGLFDALDYAFEIGYDKISMNTNGTSLNREIAKRLAVYEGLSISVSLEGPQNLHDRIRGKGAYGRAVRGIERALEERIDLVIFSVACRSLLGVLPHFVDAVYRGFPGIQYLTLIQLIATTKNGFALSGELLEPQDFIELVQTVCILNLSGFYTKVKNSPLARLVSELIGMPWVPPTYPLYRAGSLFVMADGNLRLAHSRKDSLGKYAPGMIQNVLSSDRYRCALTQDQSTCCACKHTDLCSQHGMSRPTEPHMDLYPEVPYCRRVLDLKL